MREIRGDTYLAGCILQGGSIAGMFSEMLRIGRICICISVLPRESNLDADSDVRWNTQIGGYQRSGFAQRGLSFASAS